MDADPIIESLKKERNDKSVTSALSWLESNPVHFQIESVMEALLSVPEKPEVIERLLKYVKDNPSITSTGLAVLVKRCGRTNRAVVVAAKEWLSARPFEASAGWLLRECLHLRSGKQFAAAALNWIGTQTDSAQVADVLAALIAADANADVLMETRAWLARNWHSGTPTSDVVVALFKSKSESAFLLGMSYIDRACASEYEFVSRQDAIVEVFTWLFSRHARSDAAKILVRFLDATIEREEWSNVIQVAFQKVKEPTAIAIEFAKRWLRSGRFESGDWVIVCTLLDLRPDDEVIQIAREFLAKGLRIEPAEESIRKKLKKLKKLG